MKILDTVIFLLTFLINSLLFVTIFLHKKREGFQWPTLPFLLSLIALLFWSLFNYLADVVSSNTLALFFTRATFPAAALMGASFLTFSFLFPNRLSFSKKVFPPLALLTTLVFLLACSPWIITSIITQPGQGVISVEPGPAYAAYAIFLVMALCSILANLLLQYRLANPGEKKQARLILMGWAIFFAGALATNLLIPFFTHALYWSRFGPAFSVVMVACTVYAIMYHQFLNIRFIVQLSLVYGILISLIIGTYILVMALVSLLIGESSGMSSFISGSIAAVLGALSAQPIERFLRAKTDPIFFKDRYDLAHAIHEIGVIARRDFALADVMEHTSKAIAGILRAKKISFVFFPHQLVYANQAFSLIQDHFTPVEIGDIHMTSAPTFYFEHDQKTLASTSPIITFTLSHHNNPSPLFLKGIRVILPLHHESTLLGAILIGEKQSGGSYTKEDCQLFDAITPHLAAALEKARLYEQNQKYLRTLEKTVAKRTAEIIRLQESQKETMIDIAHNLQSPLTVVRNTLHFFHPENASEKKHLEVATRSIDRVSKFIYDLLTLARFDTLHKHLILAPLPLCEILEELCEEYSVITAKEGITFRTLLPKGLFILGDRHLIEQLITNLLSNAVKYIGDKKEPVITLEVTRNKQSIEISIRDTGIGINAEDMPHLFTRYRRTGNHALIRGSGLGLAICQKIVQAHHGRIRATSSLNKGSCFVLSFPQIPPSSKRS